MPWGKLAHERTVKVYKKFLKGFFTKANSNVDLVEKEILIKMEVHKRDFTKRQLNILVGIISFSFDFGKGSAILKPSDFALMGIQSKKVTNELEKLIDMNVLEWDRDFNEFKIKEARLWKAPFHDYYDDKRGQELFFVNLRHAGVDVEPIVKKLRELGF